MSPPNVGPDRDPDKTSILKYYIVHSEIFVVEFTVVVVKLREHFAAMEVGEQAPLQVLMFLH